MGCDGVCPLLDMRCYPHHFCGMTGRSCMDICQELVMKIVKMSHLLVLGGAKFSKEMYKGYQAGANK